MVGEVVFTSLYLVNTQHKSDCGCCSHWGGWVQTAVPFLLAVEYRCTHFFTLLQSWNNNIEVVKKNNVQITYCIIFQYTNRNCIFSESKKKGQARFFRLLLQLHREYGETSTCSSNQNFEQKCFCDTSKLRKYRLAQWNWREMTLLRQ